jgi:hypothetical protein
MAKTTKNPETIALHGAIIEVIQQLQL